MKKYSDASNTNVSYVDHSNSSRSSGYVFSSAKEDSLFSLIKDSTIILQPSVLVQEIRANKTEPEKTANQNNIKTQ